MLRREGYPELRGREPMPRVVIVGDQNSGKTTFLGLLYAAQVKFGSDKADGFRFHAAFESLDEISGVFQRLMSGSFPDAATKEGVREIAFRLGHRRSGLGILSRRKSRGSSPDSSASFQLILLKSFEDEMARSGNRGSVDQRTLSSALTGDAFVIMIDATSLAVADEEGELAPSGKYDEAVASLLMAIQRSRDQAQDKFLHPIFVLSKFDQVDPEVLRHMDLDAAPPDVSKKGPHAEYAKRLVDPSMPKTMAAPRSGGRRGLQFATPVYFFSWVRTDEPALRRDERLRLRGRGALACYPDYPSNKYLAFLEGLAQITPRTRAYASQCVTHACSLP